MPPLSAHINEKRHNYSLTMVWMHIRFISDGSPNEGGGGWLDHRRCCSQLRDNWLNMYHSSLFPSALSPLSVWPNLTVVPKLLTSPSPSSYRNRSSCSFCVKLKCDRSLKYHRAEYNHCSLFQRGIIAEPCLQREQFLNYCVFAKAWLYFLLLIAFAAPG